MVHMYHYLLLLLFVHGVTSFRFHFSAAFKRNNNLSNKQIAMGVYSEMWSPLKSFQRYAVKEVNPGAVPGTDLRIVLYPDPRLRQDNEIITEITDDIKQLAKEMLLVMHAMNGVGLAAPQVGVNKRLMVMSKEHMGTEEDEIAINPIITDKSLTFFCSTEGCLSFPELWGDVDRYNWVNVEYTNIKGEKVKKRLTDFEAILFQHEYDHLDKVLFIDRMVPFSKNSLRTQDALARMIEKYEGVAAP